MSYIHIFLNDDFYIMTLRIFIAAILCGLVGFEREINKHPAGFRTHLLVGVGSCLMMLMSLYGFESYIDQNENIRFDPARIPSYVISGIGFLGAGTILVKDATIKGLTTAASIWIVAGIGLIVGIGMYAPAVLTTIVVLLSLIFLNKFEDRLVRKSKSQIIQFTADDTFNLIKLTTILEAQKMFVKHIKVKVTEDHNQNKVFHYLVELECKKLNQKLILLDELTKIPEIKELTF